MPAAAALSSTELRDNLPEILLRAADALAARTERQKCKLIAQSPSQGTARFRQHFDVQNAMTADGILRQVVLKHMEAALSQRMSVEENISLNAILDEMFRQGTAAFVEQEREQLEAAAEAELKYLYLRALASRIVSQHEHDAQGKGVGINVEIGPGAFVRTDPELAALVLQNLVGNAVKYSFKGTVRITADKRWEADSEMWVLSVSDQGPGISRKNKQRIFDAFRRGNVLGQGGVGLGLAIAAQAAKLLGSELTVESRRGVGSKFSLGLRAG